MKEIQLEIEKLHPNADKHPVLLTSICISPCSADKNKPCVFDQTCLKTVYMASGACPAVTMTMTTSLHPGGQHPTIPSLLHPTTTSHGLPLPLLPNWNQ